MKWLYGLLLLCILVIIHEFGHYLAAKLFGVKVESFSIGFGPILLHRKIKETDWRLSLLPLGGYCGLKGEKDMQTALETNTTVCGEPDSLFGVHPLKRAAIGFAGPLFNLIFAILGYSVISMTGYTYYTFPARIQLADEVYPEIHSSAREAGLLTNDIITFVNNKKIDDFSDLVMEISQNPDKDLEFIVLRSGEEFSFTIHIDFDKETGSGKIGIIPASDEPVERIVEPYPFFQSFIQGTKECFTTINLTFKGIGTLFKGAKLQNTVSGPVRVTEMLGSTLKTGFGVDFKTGLISILELLALISVSLFIMNLLPVPVLDGGMILFALIESLIRRKIPAKVQYYAQFAGIAFISLLLIIGLSGDISYFAGKVK